MEKLEPLKQIKNIASEANYIPYQLCPKCNGEGIIIAITGQIALYTQNICDVCAGAKIIPMHALNEHLEVEKEESHMPFLIKNLKISQRLRTICNSAKIEYLHELCEFSREDLMKFRYMGQKSLNELENIMKDCKLTFKR